MQLTPHFTLHELTHSDTATRLDIDNTPTKAAKNNLKILAEGLEEVRSTLKGTPITISSGYRCLELNRLLKSKDTSAHVLGLAADFSCNRYASVKEVMEVLSSSSVEFDTLILEFNLWIHIAFPKKGEAPRYRIYEIDKKGIRLYGKNSSMDS